MTLLEAIDVLRVHGIEFELTECRYRMAVRRLQAVRDDDMRAIERVWKISNPGVPLPVGEADEVPAEPLPQPPCALCGGSHDFDTSVDSDQWNAVIRKGGLPDFLCIACIVKAFSKAGKPFSAGLFGADVGGRIEFTP